METGEINNFTEERKKSQDGLTILCALIVTGSLVGTAIAYTHNQPDNVKSLKKVLK